MAASSAFPFPFVPAPKSRITSYNVCYTKLLRSTVLLQLTLPPSLTGPGGAAMPVTFGPNDAGYSDSGAIGAQIGFDPTVGGSGVSYNFV